MLSTETILFGTLLKQLRKRAGMTQLDLAAALDCSDTHVSNLEKAHRRPDLEAVISRFIPALGLQDDPVTAAHLIERAAEARGERPPPTVILQHATRPVIQGELEEQPGALPSPPTELIGRNEEVNQLCNRLLGHSGRLLTLIGPPGIGKTLLALAVAARLQPYYPDGVFFVPLAEINDPVLMASTIVTTVGSLDSSSKPPKTKLIETLRRKTMLLVLDNCEQIRDAAPLVAELLSACAGLVILTTSRERLHLRAEQRYRVPPLDLSSAVELFTRRAVAVDADFVLTEENRPIIEAICQRLDRLPLAIELCAAQLDLLPPIQLLARLHHRRLDLLVNGAYDLAPRQRTLRHAILHSYTLLSHEERALFRSLGVFAGGFALPEVESVSLDSREGATHGEEPPEFLSTLHALIGKSLVHTETLPTGEQRFLLFETIREFALEQARAQGEEAGLRQRHYETYLHLFRIGDSHLRGREYLAWLSRLKPERDNLRAALQWTLDEARYTNAAWLMVAVSYFWVLCGNGYEETRWLAQLLPYRQALAVDLRLAHLLTFCRAAVALEEFQPLDPYMDEIIQLLEDCPYHLLHACAWSFRAWIAADVAQVAAHLEQGIELARASGEPPELGAEFGAFSDRDFILAAFLWGYAGLLIDQGQTARAAPMAAESLQLFRTRGNRTGIGECIGTLGRLALLQGDLAQAHKLFQEAATIATTFNYSAVQREWQSLLAITTLYNGDATEARWLLTESRRRCLEQKNTIFLAQICTYLAEVALWEGELDQAEQWLAQSLAYQAEPRWITLPQVERLFVAARLATAKEDYQRAAMLFGLADQVHSHIHYVIAGLIRDLADAALATVRRALGTELFDEEFTAGQQLSLDKAFNTILIPAQIENIVALPTPT